MKLAMQLRPVCAMIISVALALTAGGQATGNNKPVKWTPMGLSGGGSMYRPSFSPVDPKLCMINSDMSCVFISRDGGKNWEMINASQLQSSTACYAGYHPTDANVIFAAQNGAGMKVTRDKGYTWKQVDFPKNKASDGTETFKQLYGQIAIDAGKADRMMAGDDKGVFISQDGGKTWAACEGPEGVTIAFHFDQTSPADRRVIHAATDKGIWRSDDSGKTWKALNAIIEGRKILSFSGASNAKTKLCILYCSLDAKAVGGKYSGGLYRSSDGGKSWQSIMKGGINADFQPVGGYFSSPVAQYPYVFTTNVNPMIVVAFNLGTGFEVPHHNTVFRSDDCGESWRILLYPDSRYGKNYNITNSDYWSNGNNRCMMWDPRGAGFDYANPDRLMRSQSNLLMTDDSKTWYYANTKMVKDKTKDTPATWLCNGLVVTSCWNYYVDPFEKNRRYIGYTDIGLAISNDSDKTWAWTQPTIPDGWGNTTYEMAFEPKTKGKIWGAFSGTHDIPHGNIIQGGHKDNWPGGVGVSTDHGKTWTKSNTGLPSAGVVSIVMDPSSPVGNRTLYCSVWKNGVYKSVDDGKTWTKAREGLGDSDHPEYMYPCKIVLHKDGTLFVLLTGRKINGKYITKGPGLYRSTDGAKTWELVNKKDFFFWPKDFTVDPKDSRIVYMGANDAREALQGGLYRTTDGGATWTLLARKGKEHFGATLLPNKPGWIYMTLFGEQGLWLSKDNGKTWTPMKGLPFGGPQRVFADPDNDNAIYVTTFGGSLWHGPASE